MIGVIVTFGPGAPLDKARAYTIAEQAIPMFEGMAGLRSKTFMWDDEHAVATNVYIWESEQAARAFFTPELVAMVVELYGLEPQVQFTEIPALIDNGVTVSA
jgi:hypothetical protein